MSLREFLDVLGLPLADETPADDLRSRREGKASRLTQRLRQIEAALVRRRVTILRLRRGCAHSLRIESLEARYQLLLAKHADSRDRLARLRARMRTAKFASAR